MCIRDRARPAAAAAVPDLAARRGARAVRPLDPAAAGRGSAGRGYAAGNGRARGHGDGDRHRAGLGRRASPVPPARIEARDPRRHRLDCAPLDP